MSLTQKLGKLAVFVQALFIIYNVRSVLLTSIQEGCNHEKNPQNVQPLLLLEYNLLCQGLTLSSQTHAKREMTQKTLGPNIPC